MNHCQSLLTQVLPHLQLLDLTSIFFGGELLMIFPPKCFFVEKVGGVLLPGHCPGGTGVRAWDPSGKHVADVFREKNGLVLGSQ